MQWIIIKNKFCRTKNCPRINEVQLLNLAVNNSDVLVCETVFFSLVFRNVRLEISCSGVEPVLNFVPEQFI